MDSNGSSRSSTFSHRFSVSRSSKNLRLRRSRSTFVNHLSTHCGSRDLHVRSETFCSSSLRQARDSYSNSSSSTVSSPLPQDIHIQSWMFWARQGDCHAAAEGKTERYTKVYAVLRNEFLLLYRHEYCPSKDLRPRPLVQIAVASSSCSEDGILHVEDPYGQDMELHLYERRDFEICRRWSDALEQAAELTHSYFSTFDVNVDDLSRGSVYRGTLHDLRVGRESSLRTSVTQMSKLGNWSSLRRFVPDRISRYSTKRIASSTLKDTEV
uniref:PH domain-containing protein n=1 Tax=Peronospora matthiolae TaxID=2874970 RepID=A0AAV1UM12_9STRA